MKRAAEDAAGAAEKKPAVEASGTYYIHDNGGRPFKVEVGETVKVYKVKEEPEGEEEEEEDEEDGEDGEDSEGEGQNVQVRMPADLLNMLEGGEGGAASDARSYGDEGGRSADI